MTYILACWLFTLGATPFVASWARKASRPPVEEHADTPRPPETWTAMHSVQLLTALSDVREACRSLPRVLTQEELTARASSARSLYVPAPAVGADIRNHIAHVDAVRAGFFERAFREAGVTDPSEGHRLMVLDRTPHGEDGTVTVYRLAGRTLLTQTRTGLAFRFDLPARA